MEEIILAIDPGVNGALAYKNIKTGDITLKKMPKGMTCICDCISDISKSFKIKQAYLEKITAPHRVGNSASSSVTFGRNCGHIESSLYCFGIPTREVPATRWQQPLGTLPKEYKAKKKFIKEIMARRYPQLTVIEQVADALGILDWALNNTRNGKK